MYPRIAISALFLLLLIPATRSNAAGDSKDQLHALAEKIDRHYNNLQSLKADFTESYAGNGMVRNERGTLLLKRPGKMRWDYQQPRPKLFLSDGKTAWFYVPGEQQARKAPVKSLDDLRSPLRYLLGKTKLEKEFESFSFAPEVKPLEPGHLVLRGVPKAMADRVESVELEVSPEGQILRLIIHEVDGATTEFRFTHSTENIAVNDAQFRFSPPPGVEVVESSSLAQQ
jgi:outer membrane lipoprotein carrier protein